MQFGRGKPPETPNAPYRAARIKDERWRLAGPGFEPGRVGLRLSLISPQDVSTMFRSPCLVRASNEIQHRCKLLLTHSVTECQKQVFKVSSWALPGGDTMFDLLFLALLCYDMLSGPCYLYHF
jgi:hypothetical protein